MDQDGVRLLEIDYVLGLHIPAYSREQRSSVFNMPHLCKSLLCFLVLILLHSLYSLLITFALRVLQWHGHKTLPFCCATQLA